MSSKFLSLNADKQERILNAAMKEFAQKGYENASTNEIVKLAGISKGLLFHYFKNKKELYLFLFHHLVSVLMEEFFDELNFDERDIFERLKNVMILKSKVINKYPEVFNFMMSAHLEQAADIKGELDMTTAEMMKSSYARIFENIDLSRFREGIDLPRTFNIIMWTLEGFSNQAIEKAKHFSNGTWDFEESLKEAEIYVDMLKKAFYKQ